ncbi:MAG: hypothetical protein IJW13_01390 [Clostridia bacterium]|nr:hypothetical protein [Clostridia bacterium]
MQVKKLDASAFLTPGESVKFKTSAMPSKLVYVEGAICFLVWLLTLAGDGFTIGAAYYIKDVIKGTEYFIFAFIALLLLHILPFGFWLISILKKLVTTANKWYCVTDKRVVIVSGVKPISVTFVNLNEITSFDVSKNSVTLFIGEERVNLNCLPNPFAIADILEQYLDEQEQNLNEQSSEQSTPVLTEEEAGEQPQINNTTNE